MTDEALIKIITELENRNEKEKAYFGFYQYGGAPDESCIKANRIGIELFAAELLKAGIASENLKFSKNRVERIELSSDWIDVDGGFFFDHIEITDKIKLADESFPEYKETWKDKIYLIGCIGMGIILVGLIIIGLYTIIT